MEKTKTAVDWFYEQLKLGRHHMDEEFEEMYVEAKKMEEEQQLSGFGKDNQKLVEELKITDFKNPVILRKND